MQVNVEQFKAKVNDNDEQGFTFDKAIHLAANEDLSLEKTIHMNMNYNYLTTIFRGICISGIIYNFSFWHWKVHKQK